MGILKEILGRDDKAYEHGGSGSLSAFDAAEAAMDRAIQERQVAEEGRPASEAQPVEPQIERGEDRRNGDGVRPCGHIDRRIGQDRRAPKVFGRRGLPQG